ncbi:MAG: class I SAM-dependent methyltransferase, partial [Candidatus Binatia bacterium]
MEFPRVATATLPAPAGRDVCTTCGLTGAVVPYRRVGDWPLVRCRDCGLVSLSGSRDAGGDLSATNEPFFSNEDFHRWFLDNEPVFRERSRRDLDELARFANPGRLLDVGCGVGLFLDEARRCGWQVQGLEASAAPGRIARERFGLPVITATIADAGLPDRSFDVVTFFDVLEHLPDPRAALDRAARILRPGGLLVAQSPNLQSLMARLTGEQWRWYFLPQHLHHFTPSTLGRLLCATGLRPVRVRTLDSIDEFAANLRDR